jgi:hypothetical protein
MTDRSQASRPPSLGGDPGQVVAAGGPEAPAASAAPAA